MSIRVMSAVWDNSQRRGAELLVLLALADWSNDRGECDPSYSQLARKARVDRRRAIRIVQSLARDGELVIEVEKGHTFARGATSNRIVLARYATDPSGTGATTLVAPVPPPLVAPVPPTTVNINGQHQQQDTTVPTGGTVPPTANDSATTVTERPTKAPKRRKQTALPDGYHDVRDAIVAVCRFDPATISRGTHVQIDAAAKALARAGVTGPDVRSVGAEWYRKDWRGERGNPPTVRQLQDQISMRRGPAVAADASHGGVMTEDDLARRWPGFVFTIPGTHKRAIKTLPALAAEGAVTLDGVDALDPATWPADYRAAVQAMERLRAVAS